METEILTYAVELDGKVFGWQEAEILKIEENGTSVILIRENARNIFSALGAEVNTQVRSEYRLDPDSWELISCENTIDQESVKYKITAAAAGEIVRITLEPGGGDKDVRREPEVIFENPYFFPHLKNDFGTGGLETKRYGILDLLDRKVHEVSYTRKGTETLELAGRRFEAVVLDSLNYEVGLKLRLWIDRDTGRLLKMDGPRSRLRLDRKSIKRRIERASLDGHILAPAGTLIADVAAISRLKVRAVLEPVGNWITAESLNVPGQTFEGAVEANGIQGIFEIAHARYNGRDAPPYPPDFGSRSDLGPFLSPEDFIESDDPVLVEKAREIAGESPDSWEAAKRLSRWVADNIGYDIPGGASARHTYDLREGECGAHSRLFTAFCRAAGIPARAVWGCMYLAERGGSFGQHAWNEVYMGEETGWIPLDTTAREIDFADSGHIRLGVLSSAHIAWNPKQMEILDFEAGGKKSGTAPADAEQYRPYLGQYRGPGGRAFTVLVQAGGLALDVPGRGTFALRDPDEQGNWNLRQSSDVGISFSRDDKGNVSGFILTNRIRIPKLEDSTVAPEDVPEKFRPYIGRYPIPMDKREFVVGYRGGTLAINMPGEGFRGLSGPDESGGWGEKSSGHKFFFVLDEAGKVRSMILHEIVRCRRID